MKSIRSAGAFGPGLHSPGGRGLPEGQVSPWSSTGSGCADAVRVDEPRLLHEPARRPVDRIMDLVAEPDGLRRPVQPRRRVEVAEQHRGDALVDERYECGDGGLHGGNAHASFDLQDRRTLRAAPDQVRAVGPGRQMHVRQGNDLAGSDLHEQVEPAATGSVDQWQPRDDLLPHVVVRVAERLGQARNVAEPLLDGDHVGVGGLRAPDDAVEVHHLAAVLDVELHHAEHDGRGGGGRGRREQRGGERHRDARAHADPPERRCTRGGHGQHATASGRPDASRGRASRPGRRTVDGSSLRSPSSRRATSPSRTIPAPGRRAGTPWRAPSPGTSRCPRT